MYFEYGVFLLKELVSAFIFLYIFFGIVLALSVWLLNNFFENKFNKNKIVGCYSSTFSLPILVFILFCPKLNAMEIHHMFATDKQKLNFSHCVQEYGTAQNLNKEEVRGKLLDGYALDIAEFCSRNNSINRWEKTVKQSTDPCIKQYQAVKGLSDRDMAVMLNDGEENAIRAYCRVNEAIDYKDKKNSKGK